MQQNSFISLFFVCSLAVPHLWGEGLCVPSRHGLGLLLRILGDLTPFQCGQGKEGLLDLLASYICLCVHAHGFLRQKAGFGGCPGLCPAWGGSWWPVCVHPPVRQGDLGP